MPNIASVLKAEIVRLARREVRTEVEQLKKATATYRAQIADLRRQVVDLRQRVSSAERLNGQTKSITAATDDGTQIRWSPAKLKRHRERLELSADKFGKLFGVTGQTIYNWESGTRPDRDHLFAISQLRNLSKRKALAVIAVRT